MRPVAKVDDPFSGPGATADFFRAESSNRSEGDRGGSAAVEGGHAGVVRGIGLVRGEQAGDEGVFVFDD